MRSAIKAALPFIFFLLAVVLLTRVDYFVNSDLYRYGLVFDNGWYDIYIPLYLGLYQAVIFLTLWFTRDLRFLLFTQGFFWSSTQDIFYFYLWDHKLPPSSLEWCWSGYYENLGTWNTTYQVILSIIVNGVMLGIIALMTYRGYRSPGEKCACSCAI